MEGLWLAQRLCQSINASTEQLPSDYDVSCSSQFQGCGRTCHTIVRVTCRDVQVFCGTEPMGIRLATDGFGMEAPTAAGMPSAMVVAVALAARDADHRLPDELRVMAGA